MSKVKSLAILLCCVIMPLSVSAEEVQIAVAANFTAPLRAILTAFEQESGVVPADMHAPIRQDAVILQRGKENRAVTELFAYLKSA